MFTPVLVWGLLFVVSRLGGVSPTRFSPWLRIGFLVLSGPYLILSVFDRTRWLDVVAVHAWGLFAADVWIQRKYKQQVEPLVTSLKL